MKGRAKANGPAGLALAILCLVAAARAAPQENAITEITFQETPCYGTCPVDRLVLKADGTARYIGSSHTRRIGAYRGRFWKGDFEKLAQWIASEGFFEMSDRSGFANADTSDHIVSAVRGGKRKTVIHHDEGSLAAWGIEQAIRGIAFGIDWKPEPSGLRGTVAWRAKDAKEFLPMPDAFILIRPDGGGQEFALEADKQGRFEIPLEPGAYDIVLPTLYRTSWKEPLKQAAKVEAGKFRDIEIKFDRSTE